MNRVNLTVKIARREQKTMPTPGLVNMANQFSHTLDESPQKQTNKKTPKALIFNSSK